VCAKLPRWFRRKATRAREVKEGDDKSLGQRKKGREKVAINRDSKRMGEGGGKESETKGRDGSDETYSNSAYDFEHNSDDDM